MPGPSSAPNPGASAAASGAPGISGPPTPIAASAAASQQQQSQQPQPQPQPQQPKQPAAPILPPLPANVTLDARMTKMTIVPLATSLETIPMLSEDEIGAVKEWMKADKEYDGMVKKMKERMGDEVREMLGGPGMFLLLSS